MNNMSKTEEDRLIAQAATEEQNFWDVYEDSASLLHITHQSITKAKKRLLTHLRQTISQPTPGLTCVYVL
jgi:hypothetical protein